jgi:hypothetical protein
MFVENYTVKIIIGVQQSRISVYVITMYSAQYQVFPVFCLQHLRPIWGQKIYVNIMLHYNRKNRKFGKYSLK